MTKREAKIEALRFSAGLLNGGYADDDGGFSERDADKIRSELQDLADSMQRRAENLGGEFNRFTGKPITIKK